MNTDTSDLQLLVRAAREAGAIAAKYFQDGTAKVWDKSENHPVTDADIAVNDYLLTVLMSARPDYGWLSEETKDDHSRTQAKRSFVIDPIDGTRAFIDGRPHFTICLAVIENGKSIAGVVYNPLKDEMYEAVLGGGARLNGDAIAPNVCAQIQDCTMVGYPRKFRRLGWPDMNVSIRNSMAYRIVMVAAGKRDATVSFTPKSDWDLAAATLIAQEAGAMATDLEGDAFDYAQKSTSNNGVICASPTLHGLLLEQVKHGLAHFDAEKTQYLETTMSDRKTTKETPQQLLHIVIGGELIDPMKTEFINLSEVIYIGAYPSYETAYDAWKNAAQTTVDNAHMRFFILHAHELIDPDHDGIIG
ncbi:MAG: inositol monophosphatase [Robiginitomaculum sp.]|nr:MAG: inositol monophosphatase [Robiginitomaculum sp.]